MSFQHDGRRHPPKKKNGARGVRSTHPPAVLRERCSKVRIAAELSPLTSKSCRRAETVCATVSLNAVVPAVPCVGYTASLKRISKRRSVRDQDHQEEQGDARQNEHDEHEFV